MKLAIAVLGTGLTCVALLGATRGAPQSAANRAMTTGATPRLSDDVRPAATIDFKNDLVPVFTKVGCNAGGCHGAAIGNHSLLASRLYAQQSVCAGKRVGLGPSRDDGFGKRSAKTEFRL